MNCTFSECQCKDKGISKTSNGSCHVVTGQCFCASQAIIGRTCNTCAKGTRGKRNLLLVHFE